MEIVKRAQTCICLRRVFCTLLMAVFLVPGIPAAVPDDKPVYMLESFDKATDAEVGVAGGIASPVNDMSYIDTRSGSIAVSEKGEDGRSLAISFDWDGEQKQLPVVEFALQALTGQGMYMPRAKEIRANWKKAEGLRIWFRNDLSTELSFTFYMFMEGFGDNNVALSPYKGGYLVREDTGEKEDYLMLDYDSKIVIPAHFKGWVVIPTQKISGSSQYGMYDSSCGVMVNPWHREAVTEENRVKVSYDSVREILFQTQVIADVPEEERAGAVYMDSLQLFGGDITSNYKGAVMETAPEVSSEDDNASDSGPAHGGKGGQVQILNSVSSSPASVAPQPDSESGRIWIPAAAACVLLLAAAAVLIYRKNRRRKPNEKDD